MNKNVVYVAVFAALCVLAGVLVGASIVKKANPPLPMPQAPDFAQRGERFMEERPREPGLRRVAEGPLETLTNKLGLNDEQRAKVGEILEKARGDMEGVGKNIRSAITNIRERSDKEIMAILTPPQQEKFKALQDMEKEHRQNGPRGEREPMRDYGPPPGEDLPPQR